MKEYTIGVEGSNYQVKASSPKVAIDRCIRAWLKSHPIVASDMDTITDKLPTYYSLDIRVKRVT